MSPPPSKEQKDSKKNSLAEDIPTLEDIIGQMPKGDVDEITTLQVNTYKGFKQKTIIPTIFPVFHFRLVKYPMLVRSLVLSGLNTITDQLGQGCVFMGSINKSLLQIFHWKYTEFSSSSVFLSFFSIFLKIIRNSLKITCEAVKHPISQ